MAPTVEALPFLPDKAFSSKAQNGLLHKADTFPRCAKVRRCWRNGSGQLRCGYATRCQECHWVKRCTRADGCRFVQSCKFGPYKPVLKTN